VSAARCAAIALACVASCAPLETHVEPLAQPSRAAFAELAGPLLAKRCCDASCHGDAQRPYALYAVGRRRLDPAETYASTPLTADEIEANYRATLGFVDAPRGRDTTLIQKALAVGGPGGHRGGAVFEAPSDPECVAIINWIEDRPW